MKKIWMSIILLIMFFTGCSSHQAESVVDYPAMEEKSEPADVFNALLCPLENYNSFIIEPLVVGEDEWFEREGSQEVVQYLDLSVRKAILADYNIVTEPAEGVARLEKSLVEAETLSLEASESDFKGVVLVTKITDSVTGKVLLNLVQAGERRPLSYSAMSRWYIGSRVIDRWIEEFNDVLTCKSDRQEDAVSE